MDKKRKTQIVTPAEMAKKIAKSLQDQRKRSGDDSENRPPPSQLGRYTILKTLGRGGMGHVYLGYDRQLERDVAIKTIRKKLSENPYFRERFISEAKIAASIDHPNIVKIYDWGTDEVEGNYIVMEYLNGETLHQRVKETGPLDVDASISIISTLLRALEVLNKNHLVHRDIKPANIILTESGDTKLMDLGIAKSISHSQMGQLTEGSSPGTPDFMAPEQKDSSDIDVRADIYSVGKTFIYILTGDLKLKTLTSEKVEDALRALKGESLGLVDSKRFDHLVAIISKMIESGPDARYRTPGEVLGDLKKIRGSTPSSFLSKPAIIVTLLIVLLVLGGFFFQNGKEKGLNSFQRNQGEANNELEKIQHAMKLVDEIDAKIKELERGDGWSSSPLVLLIPPISPDSIRFDTTASSLALYQSIRNHTVLPVVDRDDLTHVLQEIKLDVSELANPQAHFQLRTLLPASILIRGFLYKKINQLRLGVKLVNVQTTQVIKILDRPFPSSDNEESFFDSLGKMVVETIRSQFPLRGKITRLTDHKGEINLGSYHGVNKGFEFKIFKPVRSDSGKPRPEEEPIGTAVVVNVDNFIANVRLQEITEAVAVGMLVMEPKPE